MRNDSTPMEGYSSTPSTKDVKNNIIEQEFLDFEFLFDYTQKRKATVLGLKANEYASDNDRMHNFREIAKIMRMHELDVVKALLGKHLVSVIDMIEDIKNGVVFTIEYIDEKVGDLDNYTSPLLEYMIREHNYRNIQNKITQLSSPLRQD